MLFLIVFFCCIVILPILAAFYVKKTNSPKGRGEIGEKQVERASHYCFDSSSRILRNLYLPWGNGATSEIDEIVVSSSGICN